MRYLLFQILFFLGFYAVPAEVIGENFHHPKKNYALFLTAGSEAHHLDTAWGGCHITLAGFHHKHGNEDLMKKVPQIIKKSSKARQGWRPEYIRVQKYNKNWSLIFYSSTLNKLARQLSKGGFEKVKGPKFSKSPFHMAIPHIKDQEEAEEFARKLKDTEWFLTQVELKPSTSLFPVVSWLQYFRF